MKHFVLASHGNFADIKDRVRAIVDAKKPEEDLIIVTDVFRGSVNNEFMNYTDRSGIYVIAGMNLALLLELQVNQDMDSVTMIRAAIRSAQETILFCNEKSEVQDEDF